MLEKKRWLNSMTRPSEMNHSHLAYPFIVHLLRLVPFFFYPYLPVSLKRIQNKVKLIRWWWGTNKKKHELNLVEMSNGASKVFVGSRTRHCGIVFHFPLGQIKIDEHGSWGEGKNTVEYGKVATEVRGDKGRHCQLSVSVRGTGLYCIHLGRCTNQSANAVALDCYQFCVNLT